MSFTYDGKPGESPVDTVRFHLGDTDPDDALVSDEEIKYLVETLMPVWNSYYIVAAVAAENLANRFARELSVSGDGVSINAGELQARFEQVAANLRAMHANQRDADVFVEDFTGVLAYGYDSSLAPLNFGIGQHDSAEAGRQDMGRPQRYRDPLEEP